MAKRSINFGMFAFPLLILVLLAAAFFGRSWLWSVFESPQRLRAAVEGFGWWGPAVFIALQVLQVVVFVIPGEIAQIAGGYLFGAWAGTLLSVVGIGLGSALNFFLARSLGTRFVAGLFGAEKLARFGAITKSGRSEAAFFLLFVIPGLPKDLLCFVAGLSPIPPFTFLAVSVIGRLPGVIGSSVMGAAAESGSRGLFLAIATVASLLFLAGLAFKDKLHDWAVAVADRLAQQRGGRSGEGDAR
jgi:uncharacterized membrane protein YdjX (TVP38/TMEM64 family)